MWCPLLLIGLYILKLAQCHSWVEVHHDPSKADPGPPREINGSGFNVPFNYESPDFRLPEPPWKAYKAYFYKESNRPYRLSPFVKMLSIFNKYIYKEFVYLTGCACCTVFKRVTPLAGCAVLTSRHILTSATATEMVLIKYGHRETLENVLGLWYDTSGPKHLTNSSYYASVARIHYHTRYNYPDRTNRSHPLPCVYDLAIYATTFNVIGGPYYPKVAAVPCNRGVSSKRQYSSTTARNAEMMHIVGYQFVWYINRVPTPFHKYLVRTRDGAIVPCPKMEWGWYHCLQIIQWGKLGLDVGGLKFLQLENYDYRFSGLVGINAISMKLRSMDVVNYFTVLDRYPVLDWLYAAYMGRINYRWLDGRFLDTQWAPPRVKASKNILALRPQGYQYYVKEPYWNR